MANPRFMLIRLFCSLVFAAIFLISVGGYSALPCPYGKDLLDMDKAEGKVAASLMRYFEDKENVGKKIQIEKCKYKIVVDGLRFVGLASGKDPDLSIAMLEKSGVRKAVVWIKNKKSSSRLPQCADGDSNLTLFGEIYTFENLNIVGQMVFINCPPYSWKRLESTVR
ncbi:hypothetical protein EZJ49_09225 [Bdellovibrio bacteriovorus]|uniref:hypothetical protein n=1 Tax=Bdellovibrio bacteriovorus TaxID=959 RepID=UPI0021D05AB1|nr:hypothetical protein [Bdellovibrio bacteriovorus]UXR63259.1 hypothetical protein EZJ49_09225 [Bdellovibrio bacteriovorus]